VNLGSPNSLAHGLGILVTPLWGTDRFATTAEQFVPVGDVGTFNMRLRAPVIPGVHRVYMRPVIDGVSWLEDEGIYLEIHVK